MALKSIRSVLVFSIIIVLFQAFPSAGNVHALSGPVEETEIPSLREFAEQVSNGQANELRGLYVPGLLAAPIVQQPAGKDDFVSPWQNVVTQFNLATKFGSAGLLAHNYLAGETFALLEEGQEVYLIHGDGSISTFAVTEIHRYQALPTGGISRTFVDLDTHAAISSADLFTRVYNRPGQVVFQTCIQAGNDPEWGRLFVIAEPTSR
jgi:hypothetical protein